MNQWMNGKRENIQKVLCMSVDNFYAIIIWSMYM